MYDVITVGSATVDGFVQTGDNLFQKVYQNCVRVPFGSKILVTDIKFDVGGGGTNSAVSLSRLGFKTSFIGRIGMGHNCQRVLNVLRKENVDTSFVQQEGGRTGFSIVLDAKGHDRTILAFKGSNNNLRYSTIKKSRLKTKWFYFSSMMGESFTTLEKLAMFAHRNNIKILFNPSNYLAKKGKSYLKKILDNTEILVLNLEEASILAGNGNKKVYILLKELYSLGPKIVVITDGKKGVHAFDNSYYYFIKPHKINVLETTGAGDAFASSFLAGIIKKGSIEFALQLGIANAESVIQHYGTKNKLLTWREALRAINKNPAKLLKKRVE
jgi:ribokinase